MLNYLSQILSITAFNLRSIPERKGAAVVIRLDKITNMGGQVLQSR